MMRIIQPFAKQHTQAMFRTVPRTMSLGVTNKATTSAEEEICVMVMQTGESIRHNTVHGYEDGEGEQRLFVERDPVDAMVI
jgi:hypothetical protein